MLRKSTAEESVGCLFSIVGAAVGPVIFLKCNPPPPDACGLPVMGGAFLGVFLGTFSGALVGMIVGRLLPPPTPGVPVSQQNVLQKLQCDEQGGCVWGLACGAAGFLIGWIFETDLLPLFGTFNVPPWSAYAPILRAFGLLGGIFVGLISGIVYRHWIHPSDAIVPPINSQGAWEQRNDTGKLPEEQSRP